MEKRVIIVGAGIAGLTAGCYARRNGYETIIFESHSLPGGLCTAWKRKGYTFDISMHMLVGAVSGPFHRMWEELGIIDAFRFHSHDHISAIETQGKRLLMTTDRQELESSLLELSPNDKKKIRELMNLLFGRDMMGVAPLAPSELLSFREKMNMFLKILPAMGTMIRYGDRTVRDFADELSDPFVREVIRLICDDPGWPMVDFPLAYMMGFINSGVTEAPAVLGGSFQVMQHLADRFQDAGGELHYKSRVADLIVEDNKVSGVVLNDGSRHEADEVLWAGDGRTLIYDILDGNYISDRIEKMYRDWKVVKPIVHVMMGVDMDFAEEPHRIVFEPNEPITVAGQSFDKLSVLHHCFDPSMAPKGKSAVEVWYATEYEYWKDLYRDRTAYKAEKNRIADETIRRMEERWPGFEKALEVVDVPTPVTYERYTGNWQGSPDGWYLTPANLRNEDPLRTLPGLKGLQMIGQWTAPFAGTVMSALTGRQAVELMCHEERKPFQTEAKS